MTFRTPRIAFAIAAGYGATIGGMAGVALHDAGTQRRESIPHYAPPGKPPGPATPEQSMRDARGILSRQPGHNPVAFIDSRGIPARFNDIAPLRGRYLMAEKDIEMNPTADTVALAATLAHEARHAFQDVVVNIIVPPTLPGYTPTQRFAIERFHEADSCAYGVYTLAHAAREDEGVRARILDTDEKNWHINIAGQLYKAALEDGADPPEPASFLSRHVRDSFDLCLATVRGVPHYRQTHMDGAESSTEYARLMPSAVANIVIMDTREIDKNLQRAAYPSLGPPDAARGDLAHVGEITVDRIISAEDEATRKKLAAYEGAYNDSRIKGRSLGPSPFPSLRCEYCVNGP